MTSEIIYAPMNEAEARRLTAQIASSVENTYDLLDEAMRREAWKALGYKTPAAYLRAEFPVSKSRAYQLIDQATVRRELTAIGVHNVDDLPEAHARVLAPIVRKGGPAAAAAVVDAARAKHGTSVTADDLRAASQPASHPPLDGDRSTHPAPEVPPAPSSPYSDEIIEDAPPAARILGDQFTEREDALLAQACREAGIAAEPSEPGVAGARDFSDLTVAEVEGEEMEPEEVGEVAIGYLRDWGIEVCTDPAHADLLGELDRSRSVWDAAQELDWAVAHWNEVAERDPTVEHLYQAARDYFDRLHAALADERPPHTQPADLLGLIRDLARLLLPRDEEDWRAWDLGDQEPEGRALMARVRGLLHPDAPTVQAEAPDDDAPGDAGTAQDAPEEAPSPDARIPAIRARLEALSAKQRAAFCRMHNVRAEALDGWVAGLNDGELDTAARELGLVGAETA